VTLVGGGALTQATFRAAIKRAPTVVAADGAGAACLAYGVIPDAVIGDFDSLDETARADIPKARLHVISEQDSTDFEKSVTRIDAPLIFAVGFMGRRVDHELAVYSALVRHPHKRCIIVGETDVVVAAPPHLTLQLPVGTRVSLFPLGAARGRSEGLTWPLEGLEFAPNGQIGTSNKSSAETVQLDFEQSFKCRTGATNMLLILPRAHLDVLAEALLKNAKAGVVPL
jgi:thiamine pyrophosphokinase